MGSRYIRKGMHPVSHAPGVEAESGKKEKEGNTNAHTIMVVRVLTTKHLKLKLS